MAANAGVGAIAVSQKILYYVTYLLLFLITLDYTSNRTNWS